jgi:thioredoxin 2
MPPCLPVTPIALTAADFDLHAQRAEIPLVVDFWAPLVRALPHDGSGL